MRIVFEYPANNLNTFAKCPTILAIHTRTWIFPFNPRRTSVVGAIWQKSVLRMIIAHWRCSDGTDGVGAERCDIFFSDVEDVVLATNPNDARVQEKWKS